MGQMLKIIRFDPIHLEMIQPREFEAREMMLLGNYKERATQYLMAGPAFSGVYAGEIMACCGLIKLWTGVFEMWCITTPLAASKALSFHRAVKYGLEQLRITTGLWRLQTAIHKDHTVSQKWIQRLGFEFEGERKGYGPDKSTYLGYGRFYG